MIDIIKYTLISIGVASIISSVGIILLCCLMVGSEYDNEMEMKDKE